MHFKIRHIPKASWIEHARITSSWRTIRSHPPYLPSPAHTSYSSLPYSQRSRHLISTSSGASFCTSCTSTLSATCLWKHKESNQSSSIANGTHRLPCGDLAELSRTVIEERLFQTTLTNSTITTVNLQRAAWKPSAIHDIDASGSCDWIWISHCDWSCGHLNRVH